MVKISEGQIERIFQGSDFLRLLREKWKLFASVFLSVLVFASLIYSFKVPYVGKGRLLVNDSQNSSLQAFSTSYFGMTKSVADGKKGNTQIGKQVEVLRTREFYNKFIEKIKSRGESLSLSIEEQRAYMKSKEKYFDEYLKDEEGRQKFIMKLDSWFQAKMETDYELRVGFSTPSKDLSLFLTNTALELSSEYLRDREMREIERVEGFITEQKMQVDRNIKELTQELSDFQSKPENLISMTSREKVGEYLSDLMVRMNEARLKIAENNKDMEFLKSEISGVNAQPSSALYGVGGRMESLRLENKMLASRLIQLKGSIDSMGQQLKVLPVSVQMLEDKRKKSELEYTKYKELSETLAKVEAQKLSISDRFEILEKARSDNTLPQVDLGTVTFLSLVLSLVIGLSLIYVQYLFNPRVLQKVRVRGIAVVDERIEKARVFAEKAKVNYQRGKHDVFQ